MITCTCALLHASWLKPTMAGLVNASESGWELGLVDFFSGTRNRAGKPLDGDPPGEPPLDGASVGAVGPAEG